MGLKINFIVILFMLFLSRRLIKFVGYHKNLHNSPSYIMKLDQVADVDIDKSGKFKYILINVKDTQTKAVKNIVRGYKDCSYHIDILSKVTPELEKLGLQAECSGGGRILHDPKTKTIMIYGYSQGFGRADHTIAHALCKKNFPDYVDISWSNEGY